MSREVMANDVKRRW